MTRREEITQSAKNKYPYIKGLPQSASNQAVFIEAAEWADKTMIEKASEWLKEQDMNKYLRLSAGMICVTIFDKELFIKDFLKVMEE